MDICQCGDDNNITLTTNNNVGKSNLYLVFKTSDNFITFMKKQYLIYSSLFTTLKNEFACQEIFLENEFVNIFYSTSDKCVVNDNNNASTLLTTTILQQNLNPLSMENLECMKNILENAINVEITFPIFRKINIYFEYLYESDQFKIQNQMKKYYYCHLQQRDMKLFEEEGDYQGIEDDDGEYNEYNDGSNKIDQDMLNQLNEFEKKFLKVDQNTLFELLNVADYIGSDRLIKIVTRQLHDIFKDKNTDELIEFLKPIENSLF